MKSAVIYGLLTPLCLVKVSHGAVQSLWTHCRGVCVQRNASVTAKSETNGTDQASHTWSNHVFHAFSKGGIYVTV